MKPIPVAFHIGPLEIHTYGLGLAVTFWFAYRYFVRRLAHGGYRTDWVIGMFIGVVVAAIVGARALHVLTNLSYYRQNPGDVLAVWHGGLSSFGGLLLAVPTGILIARQSCPELPIGRALDLIAPVLMAAWAMGRLLGPQLMVAGGGHPTHQWFGMYYSGQPGRRIPVPIIQAIEDFAVFCILIAVERRLARLSDRRAAVAGGVTLRVPTGVVLGTGMVLWGIERTLDEHLWLGEDSHIGSLLVQGAGLALAIGGFALLVVARARWQRWLAAAGPSEPVSGERRAVAGLASDAGPAGQPSPG
jgi:phosphatidylglycerol:prolipoprotein diacylglycerol transferase